ncbi:restriction endonuclease subunit S [Flavobacterium sp. GSP11]|uniref:restriction endonuclease subunit S n=1 Tax=Flavobacterium sp. GSP11 TaxID=3401730 RepID=UPI003AADE294
MELTINERIGNNIELMQKVELGNIFKITSGGTPSRNNENFYGGSIPWIKTGDLKGKYLTIPKEKITEEGLNKSSAKIFPKNTVLLAMYGATIGACSILPFEAATNQACAALLPTEKCNEIYLYYFLISFKDELIKLGVGGAQPNISAGIIKKIQIPFPPLPTQQKIAEILDTADQLRQYNKQLIEKYDALTQSLFLDMFGDLVNNQKKWEFISFGSVFNSLRYGTSSPPIYQESGIPFIRATNVKNGNVAIKGMVYISEDEASKIKKCKLNEGDLIIVRSGANTGDCCRIPKEHQDSYGGFDIIIEINEPHSTFYNFLLNTKSGKAVIEPFTRRAGQPHLNSKQITELQLINPPIILQTQFAERLQMVETQKQQAQEALAKSEDLFQSLLQRAFKGELN